MLSTCVALSLLRCCPPVPASLSPLCFVLTSRPGLHLKLSGKCVDSAPFSPRPLLCGIFGLWCNPSVALVLMRMTLKFSLAVIHSTAASYTHTHTFVRHVTSSAPRSPHQQGQAGQVYCAVIQALAVFHS